MECWRKVCWPSLTNFGKLRLFVNLNFHVLFWVVFSHHLSSIYWNSLHVLIDGDYTSPTSVNFNSRLEFPASIEASQLIIICQCPDCINLQRLYVSLFNTFYWDFTTPHLWQFTECYDTSLWSVYRDFLVAFLLSIGRYFIIKIK